MPETDTTGPDQPVQIPTQGRPIPVQESRPPLLPENGETPADQALAAAGGEIIPSLFGGKPLPVEKPKPASAPIDAPDASVVEGEAAPKPPPETAEQKAWRENLAGIINVELNIYHSCFKSVRNMVNLIVATTPQDSADLGEANWSAGKRSPIEQAEPEIALEVYRQVRQNMREEAKAETDEAMKALRTLGLLGGKRK